MGLVGAVQEGRANRIMEALHDLTPRQARCCRDGQWVTIGAAGLVPGDLVMVMMGEQIPADMRLVEQNGLEVDESILTGESKSISKNLEDSLWLGTMVKAGKGKGIVTAIGNATRFGRISRLSQGLADLESPLQLQLNRLGKQLSLLSIGLILLQSAWAILVQGRGWLEVFTVGVSLAVAAIPEGLPVVACVTLALSTLRLGQRGVLVRRMSAIEACATLDCLCLDKTGTLTENQLRVHSVALTDNQLRVHSVALTDNQLRVNSVSEQNHLVSLIGAWCNAAEWVDGRWQGMAVDVALANHWAEQARRLKPVCLGEVPFDHTRKYHAVEYPEIGVLVKGAPEILFPQLLAIFSQLRTVAFGWGPTGTLHQPAAWQPVALVSLSDSLRLHLEQFIGGLRDRRIRAIMVTGDGREEAERVAQLVGLTGTATDADTAMKSGPRSIVYRATPEHKQALIRRLRQEGLVVGMTGDGVNDAPALHHASLAIAMGSGTQVAQAASQLVLLNDDPRSLLCAIDEGRRVFANVRRFVRFQLTISLAALSLVSLASALNASMVPLSPVQILLINLIMDGPPAQCLALEAAQPGSENKEIVAGMLPRVLLVSTTVAVGCLLLHLRYPQDTTPCFAAFIMASLIHALGCRSEKRSLLPSSTKETFPSNRSLNWALSGTMALLLLCVYWSPLHGLVQTQSMSANMWLEAAAVPMAALVMEECIKLFMRRSIVMKRRYFSLIEV